MARDERDGNSQERMTVGLVASELHLCLAALSALLLTWTAPNETLRANTDAGQELSAGAILERYRTGDAQLAVDQISLWPSERMASEFSVPPSASDDWQIAAAAALVTEAAIRNGRFGWREASQAGRPAHWEPSTQVALDLVVGLYGRAISERNSALLSFARTWWSVAASMSMRRSRVPLLPAVSMKGFADDATLQHLQGAANELVIGPFHSDGPLSGPMPMSRLGTDVSRELQSTSHGLFFRNEVREAELAYQRAVKLDPNAIEARVRLGRLFYLMDRKKDAENELTRAHADAVGQQDSFSAAMSAMWLGRVLEDDGRAPEAEAAYRRAVAQSVPGHSPVVALGAHLLTQGRISEGWSVLRQATTAVTPGPWVDAWVGFQSAQYWRVPTMTATLRAAVRRTAIHSGLREHGPMDVRDEARLTPSLQSTQPAPSPQFRAGIDGVRLIVRVTNGDKPVRNLRLEDFELRDNGQVQRIDSAVAPGAIAAVVIIDRSPSAGHEFKRLTNAASLQLQALEVGDTASLLAFSDRMEMLVRGADPRDLLRLLAMQPALGTRTSLHDAIVAGAALAADQPGHPLVTVFSDAVDNSSWLSAPAAARALSRAGVSVDAVWAAGDYSARTDVTFGRLPKDAYVRSTGGEVFDVTSADLAVRLRRRAEEIRAAYVLAFTPTDPRRGWHDVRIRLKTGSGQVHMRQGYFVGSGR